VPVALARFIVGRSAEAGSKARHNMQLSQTVLTVSRLHRMHEMQPVVTDVCGVYGVTDPDSVWDEHSWGSREHCVRRGS